MTSAPNNNDSQSNHFYPSLGVIIRIPPVQAGDDFHDFGPVSVCRPSPINLAALKKVLIDSTENKNVRDLNRGFFDDNNAPFYTIENADREIEGIYAVFNKHGTMIALADPCNEKGQPNIGLSTAFYTMLMSAKKEFLNFKEIPNQMAIDYKGINLKTPEFCN